MFKLLRSGGATPDMFYAASIGSIMLSLILWFVPRGGDNNDGGRPEWLAIFVGLWAPTLLLMGHALADDDRAGAEVSVLDARSADDPVDLR